jgi:hypothetical protein
MSDYVEFDELGIVEIRCMNCKKKVAGRTYTEIDSRVEVGKKEKVLVIKRLSNWKQKKVDLTDGTYAEPIICVDCENIPLDLDEIESQMKKGWEKELRFGKKSEEEITKHKNKVKELKIKR